MLHFRRKIFKKTEKYSKSGNPVIWILIEAGFAKFVIPWVSIVGFAILKKLADVNQAMVNLYLTSLRTLATFAVKKKNRLRPRQQRF
jgi:hypothetical protein